MTIKKAGSLAAPAASVHRKPSMSELLTPDATTTLPRGLALPRFPDARRFDIAHDGSWWNLLYRQMPPHADWSLGNLELWLNLHRDLHLSGLDGNVVARWSDAFDPQARPLTSVLGFNVTDDTVETLLDHLEIRGEPAELHEVPQACTDRLSPELFLVSPDLDSSDYLYSTSEHRALSGKRFARLRNKLAQFHRSAGVALTADIHDQLEPERREEVLAFASSWSLTTHLATNVPNYESAVLPRALELFDQLPMALFTLRAKSAPVAFAVLQRLPQPGAVTVNHLKYDPSVRNAFIGATHYLAASLHDQGITLMNYEQDLGIAGLRTAKTRLRPHHRLTRCTVARAGDLRAVHDEQVNGEP